MESDSLGKLPKADRSSELQRRSIAVFQSSLPPDRFVFREERTDDAGVDGSLEVLIDGQYTNLRSQVQLKATESKSTNADGSVSITVRTSNLNYLLNGPSPIYVLHDSPSNELRFAWARDERRRLDNANPNWTEQETITIRFEAVLTPEAIDQIHYRIREEAQFQRKVIDLIGAASSTDSIAIRINTENLAITDRQKAKEILIRSGTAIVSAGYIREVKNLLRLLDGTDAQEPRILLVQAQADFNLQRYESALATVAEISLRLDELSEEDCLFLEAIRDGSEFQTGRIDLIEFRRRLDSVNLTGAGRFALSNRLERQRYMLFGERDTDRRAVLLNELQVFVKELIESNLSDAFKIHARIYLVEAVGQQFLVKSLRDIGDARIRLQLGRSTDFRSMFAAHAAELTNWDQQAVEVIKDAVELGSPYLMATAMVTRGNISHGVLTNQRIFSNLFRQTVQFSDEFIQSNIDNATQAIEVFVHAGNLEGELRSRMLLADLYDLIGRSVEARRIASDVLPKAKAMNYAALIGRAEDHLSGSSLQSKLDESGRPKSEEERIRSHAEEPDDELRRNASGMLRILRLPEERLPVMEREYESYRAIAREQLTWCRHLDLIQDKRHELHPSTHFRVDPTRFGLCKRFGYRSTFGNSHWPTVLVAFKAAYCQGCLDKSPIESSAK